MILVQPANGATPESDVLIELFSEFDRSRLRYCVCRNYEGLPFDLQGSDLDVFIKESQVGTAIAIIQAAAAKCGGFAIHHRRNDHLVQCQCIGFHPEGEPWGLQIDLKTGLRWRGMEYYSVDAVLDSALLKNGVRVAEEKEAVLVSLLEKTVYNVPVSRKFDAQDFSFDGLPKRVKTSIARAFGSSASSLMGSYSFKKGESAPPVSRALRRGLLWRSLSRAPHKVLLNQARLGLAYLARIVKRPGILVAVLGIDGSGKSTLINMVKRDYERLAHRESWMEHSRPALLPALAVLFRQEAARPPQRQSPHDLPPSGVLGSLFRMAYYTMDYSLGYLFRVYPKLVKNQSVFFFDRYFYDYYIDPERNRVSLRPGIIALFGLLVPKPDLILILKTRPETAFQRKHELPLQELTRQVERLENLAARMDHCHWIETDSRIEESRSNMLYAIVQTLTKKNASMT